MNKRESLRLLAEKCSKLLKEKDTKGRRAVHLL